jgi:hypothetical protein
VLSYKLPREPSGPRTTLWRRLKRLGVIQLADGLVALAQEYRALAEQCAEAQSADPADRVRALRRLRTEWHAINRRDFFPPPDRDAAATALHDLQAAVNAGSAAADQVAPAMPGLPTSRHQPGPGCTSTAPPVPG